MRNFKTRIFMNARLAQTVLNELAKVSAAGAAAPVKQLEYCLHLIERQRCWCGRGWMRGGRRQGSALCEVCWNGE